MPSTLATTTWVSSRTQFEHLPRISTHASNHHRPVSFAYLARGKPQSTHHADTASDYNNAAGIAKALSASKLPRTSYFITSKIPGGFDEAQATAAIDANVKALKLEYVDLMLVHYPASMDGKATGGKASRQQTWRALEAAVKAGKSRAIGARHH